MHPRRRGRLARLAPDQRAAATAPPGPSLCIAPAGQRQDHDPRRPRRLADRRRGRRPTRSGRSPSTSARPLEMTERLDAAVAPLGVAPGAVRVRTFHALGREILRDAGVAVEPLADRAAILRRGRALGRRGRAAPARHGRLAAQDRARRDRRRRRGRPRRPGRSPAPSSPTKRAVAATGGLDFDDLILRAIAALERDPACSPAGASAAASCSSTRSRTSTGRSSGSRCCSPRRPTGSSSSATTTSRSMAGGSPTSGGSSALERAPARPAAGRPRGQLPLPATGRRARGPAGRAQRGAVRQGDPRPGPAATGRLILAPDPSDETVAPRARGPDLAGRRLDPGDPGPDEPRAAAGRRRRAPISASRSGRRGSTLPLESPLVDDLLARADRRRHSDGEPLLVALGRVRAALAPDDGGATAASRRGAARLGGRRSPTWRRSRPPSTATRARLADLRRDDAALTLATAHATKGLEFDHVDRRSAWRPAASRAPGPSAEADDPDAPTRRSAASPTSPGPARAARSRSCTTRRVPSPFLLEAFEPPSWGSSRRRRVTVAAGLLSPGPVDLADQPVDRVEERLGRACRQDVADRVLGAVRGPGSASPSRAARSARRRAAGRAAARGTRPSGRTRSRGPPPAAGRRAGRRRARPRRSPGRS